MKTRITGLVVLNPANAPDAWERRALTTIADTKVEFTEVVTEDGEPAVRMMQPMMMEEGCVKCHAWTGIPVGGLRGGTDIGLPLAPFFAAAEGQRWSVLTSFGGLWALGTGVIGLGTLRRRRQVLAEAASQARFDELMSALERSQTGFALLDVAQRVLWTNASLCRILGIGRDDATGRRAEEVVGVALGDGARTPHPGTWTAERTVHIGTEERELRLTLEPTGAPTAGNLLLSVDDVTAERTSERERRGLEQQLIVSQRMEAVGRLASGVAHDFNNMLTPVLSYADLLGSELPEGHAGRSMLDRVQRAGERCRDLARQLLSFSKLPQLERGPVELNQLVRRFGSLVERTLRNDVVMVLDLAPQATTVRGDAGQLEHVLLNLCLNAQDAMPGGGRLTVTTRLDGDRGVVLSVSDTGVGMDAATAARIFEPFFTTKGASGGTGLGLATSRAIVEQLDGRLTVSSTPGVGTTFSIHLPAAKDTVEAAPERHKPDTTPGGDETILVVEHEPLVRELMEAVLRHRGYPVLTADGLHAASKLMAAADRPVDLVVTDAILRDGPGPQVYARVRERHPGAKVLYISGYSLGVLRAGGLPEAPFLPKPLEAESFSRAVRDVLDGAFPAEAT